MATTSEADHGGTKRGSESQSPAADGSDEEESRRKKTRRPYTIKKKRETWTEEEHRKFLEALHFYHRDWKKIAAHVGTRTVFQARSHAQKYFSKVIKYGTGEYVPAPRPKRKSKANADGSTSRGSHYTPSDIPAEKITEEPILHPLVLEGKTGGLLVSKGVTPSNVLDDALKQTSESSSDILASITVVVEDATKAVEEQLYDLPATNTTLSNSQPGKIVQQCTRASAERERTSNGGGRTADPSQEHSNTDSEMLSSRMSAKMVSRIEANEARAPFRIIFPTQFAFAANMKAIYGVASSLDNQSRPGHFDMAPSAAAPHDRRVCSEM